MKKWFDNFENKKQTFITIIMYSINFLVLIVFSYTKEGSLLETILALLYVGTLILSILFTIWKVKNKIINNKTMKKSISEDIKNKENCSSNAGIKIGESLIVDTNQVIPNVSVDVVKNDIMIYDYPVDQTFLFVDVETATSSNDSVCAIGLILVKSNKEKRLYSLINPRVHITNTRFHGITDSDIIDAPTLDEFWNNIKDELCDDFVVVAHNGKFDISVLKKDFNRYNICFNPRKLADTMWVSKDILYNFQNQTGDLKLDTLARRLNIELNHHNAESDISATKEILEKLLVTGKRDITEFIKYVSIEDTDSEIGNVKKVSTTKYWRDIEKGEKPYFTNWHKLPLKSMPEYDTVILEDLLKTSSLNREDCSVSRIKKQYKKIKELVTHLKGNFYNKGAKSAKSYIEFYYMDYEEYEKLKEKGYKIYHAIEVEEFINNNQLLIEEYYQNLLNEEKLKNEQIKLKLEEKEIKKIKKEETKSESMKIKKKYIQMDDDGNIINEFNSLSEAIKATNINSKSIRDCCNGVQKHAGGFVWKCITVD